MKNKIAAVVTLSLLTLLSFGKNITNANAAIGDPVGWDYKYAYDSTSSRFEWTTAASGSDGIELLYTSPSANYYRYYSGTGLQPTVDQDVFPIIMDIGFALSTTSWTFTGGFYKPASTVTSIGSTSGTNTTSKFGAIFDNVSNINYLIGFDLSESTDANLDWYIRYSAADNLSITSNWTGDVVRADLVFNRSTTNVQWVYFPAYSELRIGQNVATTSTILLDAIYFQQLSTIDQLDYEQIYSAGYDAGEQQGFIAGQDSAESNVSFRISDLLNRVFFGVRSVFSIKIFDQLTIGSVMLFPLAFGIFTFIIRLIRGGKA